MLLMMRSIGYGQQLSSASAALVATLPFLEQVEETTRAYHASRRLLGGQEPVAVAPVSLDRVGFGYTSDRAALSGVSRFQLLRGFAREVGATPHAYLIQRRVHLVQKLLALGCNPAEAALRAGFADQSHMTRAFRRQLGVTPARYRAAVI